MNHSLVIKKTTSLLACLALLISGLFIPGLSYNVFADALISDVSDVHWVSDSSATVAWSAVEDANYYSLMIEVFLPDGVTLAGAKETGTSNIQLDVQQEIHDIIGETEYETVKVQATIYAQNIQDDVMIEQSNGVSTGFLDYQVTSIRQLSTPTNVRITDDYYLEFDYDINNPTEVVYSVHVTISLGTDTPYFQRDIEWNNGTARINIRSQIENAYRMNIRSGDAIVTCTATLWGVDGYYNSSVSEESNAVNYRDDSLVQLSVPTNVTISNDYILEFEYDVEDPTTAVYSVEVAISLGTISPYFQRDIEWDCGTARIDIRSQIENAYRRNSQYGDISVYCTVTLRGNEGFSNSLASERSNSVLVNNQFIPVEAIAISPESAFICRGNSYYLGKEITPVNAYYENLVWSSDNESVVQVDSSGQISGVGVGTANVTVMIGDISATVTVTVYSIISNVEDPQDNIEIINAAGGIIDDIVNNDTPNLSNTDISSSELADVKNDIIAGIDNGDTFNTDIISESHDFDMNQNEWFNIQEAAGEMEAEFEGSCDIEVEMYHTDSNGNNQHIANIIQLENEIAFTFPLPAGMRDFQTRIQKRYFLVRVHRDNNGIVEYSRINYLINADGTFTAWSNRFSEFVWCSIDEDTIVEDVEIIQNGIIDIESIDMITGETNQIVSEEIISLSDNASSGTVIVSTGETNQIASEESLSLSDNAFAGAAIASTGEKMYSDSFSFGILLDILALATISNGFIRKKRIFDDSFDDN